jgi:hypothetical protein
LQTSADGVAAAKGFWDRLFFPNDPTSFWTAMLVIATVALVIVAYRGLASLRLAQKDMLTRATRDARQCAVTRCEEFERVIIPMNAKILAQLSAKNVGVFVKHQDHVDFDYTDAKQMEAAAAWFVALGFDLQSECITLLNRLEAWALYFTQALADQSVAAEPCAPVYQSMVVQLYPVLLVTISIPSNGKYTNLRQVYEDWTGQLEGKERQEAMESLLQKLNGLQTRPGTGKSTLPAPLGTDGV